MTLKSIQRDKWYETKYGIGLCESVGGTRPVSCSFIIKHPVPLGRRNVSPRDVIREVEEPKKP